MALLIGGENPYGWVRAIYTIQNGVAECELAIDDSEYPDDIERRIIILENGYIRAENARAEYVTQAYYRFEEGQLKFVARLGHYNDAKGGNFRVEPPGEKKDFTFNYFPDGAEVRISEEESLRLYMQFKGENYEGKPADLNWKPLAEYGR